MALHGPITPDDTFLFDDGLPCIRREGKLYYLGDVQPRVLEACRRFGVSFEQLADKLGMMRPALVLILKGYDPVSVPLKDMLDRLVLQAACLQGGKQEGRSPVESRPDSPAAACAAQPSVTITSVPIPDAPVPQSPATGRDAPVLNGDAVTLAAQEVEEMVIPDVVSVGQLASPDVVLPTAPAFAPGLSSFTPGLRRTASSVGRRATRRHASKKQGQFLLT